jgi:hypothetical protein
MAAYMPVSSRDGVSFRGIEQALEHGLFGHVEPEVVLDDVEDANKGVQLAAVDDKLGQPLVAQGLDAHAAWMMLVDRPCVGDGSVNGR